MQACSGSGPLHGDRTQSIQIVEQGPCIEFHSTYLCLPAGGVTALSPCCVECTVCLKASDAALE